MISRDFLLNFCQQAKLSWIGLAQLESNRFTSVVGNLPVVGQ
jgi:hypothetical protein